MRGLLVFESLEEAMRAGFTVYDTCAEGYLVRQKTQAGWALAIAKSRDA